MGHERAIGYGRLMTILDILRLLANATPAGASISLDRDWLVQQLEALPVDPAQVQIPLPLVAGAIYTPAEAEHATRRSLKHLRRKGVPRVRDGARRVLYRGEDLIAFVDRHVVTDSTGASQSASPRASRKVTPKLGGRPSTAFSPRRR